MNIKRHLRKLEPSDSEKLREVYVDAIQGLGNDVYTQEQLNAWSSLASLPLLLDKPLLEGCGWVSCVQDEIEAFALRYPSNRLALLYCRSRSYRQGHATALLKCIEFDAQQEKQSLLFTEASLYSYRLLLNCGWRIITPEQLKIGGVNFHRYLMKRDFVDS